MAEFDTSLIHTDGYRREAHTRPGKRLATPLVYACDEIDRLRTRLQRAEELRNKWERHANAIPEADCVDSYYRQGFKDALMACVQDYDDTLGERHDTD